MVIKANLKQIGIICEKIAAPNDLSLKTTAGIMN